MLKKSPQTSTLFSISGRKIKTENNISDYLWTALNFEEDYNSEDDQQSKVEEGTPAKNTATQEDNSLYRHILELPSSYSPEQQQAFKDIIWNDDLDQVEKLELSHCTDSQKHEIFGVSKPYRKLCHTVISPPSESHGTAVLVNIILERNICCVQR